MRALSKAKRSANLKQGSITSTNEIGLIPRMPDMKGTCPLLLADLSDEMGMPAFGTETEVSAEVVHASEQALYLFRLQIGATLVCWLADPNDPEIHDMLQAWANAAYMFAALKTKGGVMVKARLVCGAPPNIKDIHASSGPMDAARFIRSTVEVGHSKFIKSQVQSDIASVRKIWKVRVFYVLGKAAQEAVSAQPAQF
jgi:hypothetical protein